MGSFVNALVFRLRNKKSLWQRSMCPKCRKELGVIDLIPVLSFIFLKRRCRHCHKKISWQYPLVELVTGVIFLLLYLKFITETDFINCNLLSIIDLSALFLFSVILISIFIYDLKYYIIPDKILFPGIFLALIILIFESIYSWSFSLAIDHLIAVFIVFGFFLALHLVSRGKWMGAGDVKFSILLGLIIPWPQNMVMLFLTFVLGAIVGIILLVLKKKKLKEKVPMGTFLVVGTFITIFLGEYILQWYLELIL